MDKIVKNKIIVFFVGAFYVLMFFLLLKHSFDYLDPDFGWHLKLGQEIVANLDVPRLNNINYTIYKVSWVDHEWLSNLLTYLVYSKLGYLGVNVFFAFLALSAFFIQSLIAKKFFNLSSGSFLLFLTLQLFGVFASLPSLGVRMQEFTLFFLAIVLLVFYAYEKTANSKFLFCLPFVFWLWASLHGGFLLGVGLLFFFILIKSAENVFFRFYRPRFLSGEPLPFKKIFVFAGFAGLSLLATTLTPYGLGLYEFLTSYRNNYYLGVIFEWFHQFRYPFFYWQLAYLELATVILVWWVLKIFWLKKNDSGEKISFWKLFLFVLFAVMAVKSRRHFPLFFMFSAPLLASFLASFLKLDKCSFLKNFSNNVHLDRLIKAFLFLIFISGISLQIVSIKFISNPWRSFSNKYPYAAVEYLKSHPEYDDWRLFNEFNWGGYLIWTLPEKQLFIDGRLPQYEYKGHSLLEEFYSFSSSTQAQAKLSEYDIDMVLLSVKKDEFGYNWFEKKFLDLGKNNSSYNSTPLYDFLSSSDSWTLVYEDDVARIFIRKK